MSYNWKTTEDALRKLFPRDTKNNEVSHYVDDANVLVGDLLGTSGFSDERKEMIARYYAAHLYTMAEHEGGIFEETIGESSEKRGSSFTLGQGLKMSRWGQMVLGLDTTGAFANIEGGAKKTAQFRLV